MVPWLMRCISSRVLAPLAAARLLPVWRRSWKWNPAEVPPAQRSMTSDDRQEQDLLGTRMGRPFFLSGLRARVSRCDGNPVDPDCGPGWRVSKPVEDPRDRGGECQDRQDSWLPGVPRR